jgi:periplasmic protein TonB
MASGSKKQLQNRSDVGLTLAVLCSLALHTVVFTLLGKPLPAAESKNDLLTIVLQPPPKPLPPPPPTPEPEKPTPPKPRQRPQQLVHQIKAPLPQVVNTTRASDPPPPAPQVMASTPNPESPATFTAPAPTEPHSREPSEQEIVDTRNSYGSLLSREFAKYKQYPRIATIRGWQGIVKIELHVDANGTVTSATVIESSKYEILDKQALESVHKAIPLPPPPGALRGREFTIVVPFSYTLN